MALTRDASPSRRGPPPTGEFGYPVAPGEIVYRGGLLGLNANWQLQRLQTAGCVAFAGMADRTVDNRSSANASVDKVVGLRGHFALAVPAATPAAVGTPVYATDDNTLTLASGGGALQVGTFAGLDAGATYVKLLGA